MTRNARLWIGVTLLLVIGINYAVIGFPLLRKSASLEDRYKSMLISEVKTGKIFKNSESEYIIEVFKREKAQVERKLFILNMACVSIAILVASWTVFGLVTRKGQ